MDGNNSDSQYDASEAPSHAGKGKKGGNKQASRGAWKPARMQSYETIRLTSTTKNPIIRPCGFRTDGVRRTVKDTCLMSRMR